MLPRISGEKVEEKKKRARKGGKKIVHINHLTEASRGEV
jgi:hypothetical protein